MIWRRAHGTAAQYGALVAIETCPADGLPAGVPAPSGPVGRRPNGTLTAAGGRALGRRGGLARATRRRYAARLASQLGLTEVGADLRPYLEMASEWAAAQLLWLADTVGGGSVGPGPASIVHSAALALAASRRLYQQASEAGDPALFVSAARLADQSRQSLLTAHELCAREAKARPAAADFPWLLPSAEDDSDAEPAPAAEPAPSTESST
ncbi:MAG: hypothetical protein V1750_08570 [Acidobacteriota bacterium]